MKRYTLLLDTGSSKHGELHYESAVTGYVRRIGSATLCSDGTIYYGNGYHVPGELVRVLPSVTDRVVAETLRKAGELLSARAVRRVA